MSDYIKRSEAIDIYKPYADRGLKVPVENIISNLKDLPSADVVERKRGGWLLTYTFKDTRSGRLVDRLECTACDGVRHIFKGDPFPDYCEHCGADMRGAE